MNRANMRKWIDALRGGEYRQGRSYLKYQFGNEITYCCLGVVCDLMEREGLDPGLHEYKIPNVWEHRDTGTAWIRTPRGGGTLPGIAQEWLGIETDNPLLKAVIREAGTVRMRDRFATELNDCDLATFADIADAIEYTFFFDEEGDQHG